MTELVVPADDPRFELWRLAVLAWVRLRAAELGISGEEVVKLEELAAAWKAAYSGWVRLKVRSEADAVVKDSARTAFVSGFRRFVRESVQSGLLTSALLADLREWVDSATGAKTGQIAGRFPATPREPGR